MLAQTTGFQCLIRKINNDHESLEVMCHVCNLHFLVLFLVSVSFITEYLHCNLFDKSISSSVEFDFGLPCKDFIPLLQQFKKLFKIGVNVVSPDSYSKYYWVQWYVSPNLSCIRDMKCYACNSETWGHPLDKLELDNPKLSVHYRWPSMTWITETGTYNIYFCHINRPAVSKKCPLMKCSTLQVVQLQYI